MSLDFNLNIPASLVKRAKIRIITLVLLAAIREELIARPRSHGPEELVFEGEAGVGFKAKGVFYGKSQRLVLKELLLDVAGSRVSTFKRSLAMIATLAGLDQTLLCWQSLVAELCDGVKVQAVAYLAAKGRPEPSSWREFENWTPEGHNLHPGAKTRHNFSVADHLAYAPDFSTHLDLVWLSVAKNRLKTSGFIPEYFDLGKRWALPVHPWQRQNVLPEVYFKEWKEGVICDLDRPPIRASISTSLRTVVPDDLSYPILKMSVGSLMTSTERSMSSHTVSQGPIYSEYLHRIWRENLPWLKNIFIFAELGGFYWGVEDHTKRQARQLSLLFRARPKFDAGLEAVPCSVLPQPMADDLDSRYYKHFFARGAGPVDNFLRYCQLLIPFHLHLMQTYGIALEAHLQNCVVLWSPSAPEQLGVRDWGGLRADAGTLSLKAPDLYARLDPDSLTVTDRFKARRKLIACLYANHLSEVVFGLSQQFSLSESTLWSVVKNVSQAALAPYKDSPLADEVLKKPWPVKSLLRLRLGVKGEDYRLQANPLS